MGTASLYSCWTLVSFDQTGGATQVKVKSFLGVKEQVFGPVVVPEYRCLSHEPVVDGVLT